VPPLASICRRTSSTGVAPDTRFGDLAGRLHRSAFGQLRTASVDSRSTPDGDGGRGDDLARRFRTRAIARGVGESRHLPRSQPGEPALLVIQGMLLATDALSAKPARQLEQPTRSAPSLSPWAGARAARVKPREPQRFVTRARRERLARDALVFLARLTGARTLGAACSGFSPRLATSFLGACAR